ncbi:hypothetical protein [Pseudoxanthomonas putridarboris]|uniref:Lipoprotein n=1 Tax=Pseudoxanthomonas putridarboris TaxID=752605 RepID=A0ABU9J2D1_9GAMM
MDKSSVAMLTLTLLLLSLPGLSGCASKGKVVPWSATCKTVGCTEPVDIEGAGEGSTVLLVNCSDSVREQRRYARVSGAWMLQMYELVASPECVDREP